MGHKSQRKQERDRHRQKKIERREKQRRIESRQQAKSSYNPAARHAQRLQRQTPQAWSGEFPEDVATFDDTILATLPAESAAQVRTVRAVLQEVLENRGTAALDALGTIPRSSPLSMWRLFLRGLVAWVDNDLATAADVWRRLDAERRPGRIAISLMAAHRTDLDHVSSTHPTSPTDAKDDRHDDDQQPDHTSAATPANTNSPEASQALATGPWSGPLPASLRYHAKLVRRTRIERLALRAALQAAKTYEEADDILVGPNRLAALKQFVTDHQAIEPELTKAISQGVLIRGYCQGYMDLFERATDSFVGPPHDRENWLLRHYFYALAPAQLKLSKPAALALNQYQNVDLPKNEKISAPLRAALLCQLQLNEAMMLIVTDQETTDFFLHGKSDVAKHIRKCLTEAAKLLPTNREVYETHSDWIQAKLDSPRTAKSAERSLTKELMKVMENWAHHLPNDATPRLWLVEHFVEEEELDRVKPHIEWLAQSRQGDPLARAMLWKWQLLEASRRARRKVWYPEIAKHLAEAERLWPSWLSQQWLPYWREACQLRCDTDVPKTNVEEPQLEPQTSETTREETEAAPSYVAATEASQDAAATDGAVASSTTSAPPPPLVDACMRLGAAQWLRLPASDVKRLREPVEQALARLPKLSNEELLDACAFFWDLQRTKMTYPAYRMHGGKFAKELCSRVKARPEIVESNPQDPRLRASILLFAQLRLLFPSPGSGVPAWLKTPLANDNTAFMAALVTAYRRKDILPNLEESQRVTNRLRELARTEPDSFYRPWYAQQADELDRHMQRRAAERSPISNSFFGGFGGFGGFGDLGGEFDTFNEEDL